jgi:hypothetical protein
MALPDAATAFLLCRTFEQWDYISCGPGSGQAAFIFVGYPDCDEGSMGQRIVYERWACGRRADPKMIAIDRKPSDGGPSSLAARTERAALAACDAGSTGDPVARPPTAPFEALWHRRNATGPRLRLTPPQPLAACPRIPLPPGRLAAPGGAAAADRPCRGRCR